MNIVILDGYTLNPGDLNWEGFRKLGELKVYDRTPADKILEHAAGAEILLTNKTPLGEAVIAQLPSLKYIGVLATGYNVVAVEAARKQNIIVTNVPAYGTASVVQMTIALILELCLHVQQHSDSVKEGQWSASADFCYWNFPLVELAGKTLGIIGYGHIGRKVGEVARALGMKVIYHNRRRIESGKEENPKWTELTELLKQSDVVSIHCPLTDETNGLINKESLQLMKPTAFLINTSRGPIVVDEDLADALNRGVIAGAAVDVLNVEPPPVNHPLFQARNCILTPHIAWATKEARERLMNAAVANLSAFIAGKNINVVNSK